MANVSISGKAGSVTGGNSASNIKEWSCSLSAEALDSTNFDSAGWREFTIGLKGGEGSFTALGVPPTTGAAASLALLTSTSTLTGAAIIDVVDYSVDVAGLVEYTANFKFNGVVTIS